MNTLTQMEPMLASPNVGGVIPYPTGFAGTTPVIKNQVLYYKSGGSSYVAVLPAGASVGDLAILTSSDGWFANPIPGWTPIYFAGAGYHQIGCQYKVLGAADITAGSVTLTYGGSWAGSVSIVIFENGDRISVREVTKQEISGTSAPNPSKLAYHAEEGETLVLHASARGNGVVNLSSFTTVGNVNGSEASAALGLFNPASNGFASESVVYTSSGGGVGTIMLGVTLDAGAVTVPNNKAYGSSGTGAIATNRTLTGKTYFEVILAAKQINPGVGIITSNFVFNANQIGTTAHGFAYNADGAVRFNNTLVTTIEAYNEGDIVRVAFDPAMKMVWFAVNSGAWNNDGLANPVTGVGGITIEGLIYSSYRMALNYPTSGSIMIPLFPMEEFEYAPPTGFFSMDVVGEPLVRICSNPWTKMPGGSPVDYTNKVMQTRPANGRKPKNISTPAGPVAVVAGAVFEASVPSEGRRVLLYSKNTGDLIGEAFTNAAGDYVIPASNASQPHFVIAFGDPDYNAKIYDGVIPG